MTDDGTYEVARITITRELGPDGDTIGFHFEPEDLSLVEALGMLEMGKDTAYHMHDEAD